jgi:hypothetical protein
MNYHKCPVWKRSLNHPIIIKEIELIMKLSTHTKKNERREIFRPM